MIEVTVSEGSESVLAEFDQPTTFDSGFAFLLASPLHEPTMSLPALRMYFVAGMSLDDRQNLLAPLLEFTAWRSHDSTTPSALDSL